MENKFFLHRIYRTGEIYTKGIEVHDTADNAIRSFHSVMKMGYNNPSYPDINFISCMVTNENDEILPGYNETWSTESINDFFVHYIRHDGDTYTKGIDVCNNFADALRSFHTYMEFGHNNSKFPNITMVSSKVTGNKNAVYKKESWAAVETKVTE